MPTQIQFRRATTATQQARTLAVGEPDVDTSLKRLNIHDGVNAGGMPHANAVDIQNNRFTYAAASGTNTITITVGYTLSAYAAGQSFKFKAANSITGAATLNVNSVGAANLKKYVNGSKVDVGNGDIVAGGIYTVDHDGTDFLLPVSSSGSLILLNTYTPTTVSTLDIEDFGSNYDNYLIDIKQLSFSAAGTLYARVKKSSAYITSASYIGSANETASLGSTTGNTQNVTSIDAVSVLYMSVIDVGRGALPTDADGGLSGEIKIKDANETSRFQQIFWDTSFENGLVSHRMDGSGHVNSLGTMQGLRLYPSSGTMSGIVKIYGIN